MTDQPEFVDRLSVGEDEEAEDRCQPIGCDNGYHLKGCKYIECDKEDKSWPPSTMETK